MLQEGGQERKGPGPLTATLLSGRMLDWLVQERPRLTLEGTRTDEPRIGWDCRSHRCVVEVARRLKACDREVPDKSVRSKVWPLPPTTLERLDLGRTPVSAGKAPCFATRPVTRATVQVQGRCALVRLCAVGRRP